MMLDALQSIIGEAPAGLEFLEYLIMALLLGFMCYGLLALIRQLISFIKM